MAYFDDLELVGGGVLDRYHGHLDQAWPWYISLQFCAAGRLYFGRDGADPVRIERPALFWSMPASTYRFGPLDAMGWSHHWVALRGKRIERLMQDVLDGPHPAGWRHVRQPTAVRRCIRTLIACARRQEPLDTARAAVELDHLALLLASEDHLRGEDPHRAQILDLAARISASPSRTWSWVFEARQLGWSPAHLRRRFAGLMGLPPHRYLVRYRVQLAADILGERQRRPLDEIAVACGFASARRLAQAFTQHYGMPPGRFRGTVEAG